MLGWRSVDSHSTSLSTWTIFNTVFFIHEGMVGMMVWADTRVLCSLGILSSTYLLLSWPIHFGPCFEHSIFCKLRWPVDRTINSGVLVIDAKQR